MAKSTALRIDDVRGASRLAIEATTAVTDIVEAMHHGIGRTVTGRRVDSARRTGGIARVVYASVRGVTRLVGTAIDAVLAPFAGPSEIESPARDTVLAALNGVLGDHLEASGNPLAIRMQFRALDTALATPRARLLVMVHGLCMDDRGWLRNGHDHGAMLARELDASVVYLRYNSGLPIARNGRELAAQLDALVAAWPVPLDSISIVAHSMGGLVARSATHFGGAWREKLTHLMFLGTPHHGAALERGGHGVDRLLESNVLTAPLARLGYLRSRGITDLRHGTVIDLEGDAVNHVPLPDGVACHALAARTGKTRGDGLVSIDSALGRHDPARALDFGPANTWIGRPMNHMELLDRAEVYAELVARLRGGVQSR